MRGTRIVRCGVLCAGATAIVLLAAMLSVSTAIALADDGHSDGDSIFGIVYVSLFFAAAAIGLIIIVLTQRTARNRHTGLPRPIKRRRARGPLKTGPLN